MVELGGVSRASFYRSDEDGAAKVDQEMDLRDAIQRIALKRPGLVLGSFIAFYGCARIAGEFFREPDPQLGFLWGGLTMGMLLSVPMIVAGYVV